MRERQKIGLVYKYNFISMQGKQPTNTTKPPQNSTILPCGCSLQGIHAKWMKAGSCSICENIRQLRSPYYIHNTNHHRSTHKSTHKRRNSSVQLSGSRVVHQIVYVPQIHNILVPRRKDTGSSRWEHRHASTAAQSKKGVAGSSIRTAEYEGI